jgi:hypothetical protein
VQDRDLLVLLIVVSRRDRNVVDRHADRRPVNKPLNTLLTAQLTDGFFVILENRGHVSPLDPFRLTQQV